MSGTSPATCVRWGDRAVAVAPGETLLAALEREGLPVRASCRAGACQTCLMRATDGAPPARSQVGLKDSKKAKGYFLACLWEPVAPMAVTAADDDAFVGEARIVSVRHLEADVAVVRFARPGHFQFRAGQFVT